MSKGSKQKNTTPAPKPVKAPDFSEREQKIRTWFASWIERSAVDYDALMTQDVNYVECTGDEYCGTDQISRWFARWITDGVVRKWDIKAFIHSGNTTVVEWYFECFMCGQITAMDGVSLIDFVADGRICRVREFSAEHNHTPHDD